MNKFLHHGFIWAFFALSAFAPLVAQDVHACVVMPSQTSNPTLQLGQTNSQLPPTMVKRAVALGNPNSGIKSNFWANGSTLKIKFIGGTAFVRQQVMRYANEWTRYANLNFQFVDSGYSDIRISFVNNGSSWSMLGSQARYAASNQPTMNFGWFNDHTPDYEFRRTVLHEFGHALGLLHEHQNPTGGIPWNEAAVYDFYRRTQGWDQQTTYHNVIARQDHNETQYSAYDANSIMHYPVDPQLTTGGYEVGLNTSLSPTDASFISRIYPGRNSTATTTTSPGPVSSPTEANRPEPSTERPQRIKSRLTFTNTLGNGVRAETVELTIARRKYVFRLSEGGYRSKTLELQLEPGTYTYSINSASIYSVSQKVWDGRRYVEKRGDRTIYGAGNGSLRVNGDSALIFYGKYNQQTGRMEVYLGEGRAR